MDVKTLLKKAFCTKPLTEYTEEQLQRKVKRYKILGRLLLLVCAVFAFAMIFSALPILREASIYVKSNELSGLAALQVTTPAIVLIIAPAIWFYSIVWLLPDPAAERSELRIRALKKEILEEVAKNDKQ